MVKMVRQPLEWWAGVALVAILLCIFGTMVYLTKIGTLWRTISEQCVPGFLHGNNPAPCLVVNPERDYVVLRSPAGPLHLLFVPLTRTLGSNAPWLNASNNPDYFKFAWQARDLLSKESGKTIPDTAVALTFDAYGWGTQDQLHLHLACLRPEVRNVLHTLGLALRSDRWIEYRMLGHGYWLRAVSAEEFAAGNVLQQISHEAPVGTGGLNHSGVALAKLQDGRFVVAVLPRVLFGPDASSGAASEMQDFSCVTFPTQEPPPRRSASKLLKTAQNVHLARRQHLPPS
ncbi:CDP-diacylglycerol diphosphatase [Xanthomonas cassavae]